MRNIVVTAVAAFALGGITTGVLLAHAQPAGAPPDGPRGGPMAHGPWGPGPGPGPGSGPGSGPGGPGGWGDRMHERHAQWMEIRRDFALMFQPEDRKLTPPDVQKIAEAFLLWNGNHTWKVLNVAQDGAVIGFDVGTADGSVIARYTMDPKTGHLARRG
jgi:hypothetical protein